MRELKVIRNNEELASFRAAYPNGYTILNGDRGVGLIGSLAAKAQNIGGDPMAWIALADEIGPYMDDAHN